MTITPLLGPNGKIPILIRDDDINFFTKSDMLESVYSNAWKNQFKVSLSVVPYQKAINDVSIPPNVRNSKEYYSIGNNKELCIFLKEKINHNSVEILQHGVAHTFNDGRGEFGEKIETNTSNINDLYNHYYNNFDSDGHHKVDFKSYVNLGRNIIRQSLDTTPIFFAPPFDDISKENLHLLSKLGMVPIYGQSIYHRFFRSPYIPNKLKKYIVNKIIKKFSNAGFIIPFIISSTTAYKSQKKKKDKDNGIMLLIPKKPKKGDLKLIINSQKFVKWTSNAISYCMSQRTPLCILNHYHHYFYDWNIDSITRRDLFEEWQQILNLLNQIPFSWKTTFFELYQRMRKIQNIKISKTGLKITIESNEVIEDFSFKVNNGFNLEKNSSLIFDEIDKTIASIKHLNADTKIIFYQK
jgi:hypothetical protein